MTEEQRDELLLNIYADMQVMKEDIRILKEDVSTLKAEMKEVKEDIRILKEDVSTLKAEMKQVKEDIFNLQEDFYIIQSNISSLDRKMKDFKSEMEKMSGCIAVFENDHGGKLQMLLDTISEPVKRVSNFQASIDSHEEILYEHGIRIGVLESKVANS